MGTFSERVMAQVAQEPTPTPARVFVRSVLALRLRDAGAALATAWHLAFGRTRAIPSLVRVQSLTLLLVLAVVAGSGGTLATAGALRVLDRPPEPPSPTVPAEVVGVSPSPSWAPGPLQEMTTETLPRDEEVEPEPAKQKQEQGGDADRGEQTRSKAKDAGDQQKKQTDRNSSGAGRQDPPQDGSGKSEPEANQPVRTPRGPADDGSKDRSEEPAKSGRGS